MFEPSDAVDRIEPSATMKLGDAAKAMKMGGMDIVSLVMGEPDFPTPPHISRAAKKALDAHVTHYTPGMGIPELRYAVARKYIADNKVPAKPENVMVTPTKFGIFASILGYVNKGDQVIMADPSWVSFAPPIHYCKGKPVPIPCLEDVDFNLTPDAVAEKINKKTKMIIINSPANPTGGVQTKENLKGIADLAKDHDLLVLSDETYEYLIYEGEHLSIAQLPGMFNRTITVSGLSKTFAMTGWRVGWIVAKKKVLAPMFKIQQHALTCCTSFAQVGAVAALNGPMDTVNKMKEEFEARRHIVVEGLNNIEGVHCATPKGTFYAFFSYDSKMKSIKLAERLLFEGKVALTPGAAFGEAGEYHLRMSFAARRKDLRRGLNRIDDIMSKVPKNGNGQ